MPLPQKWAQGACASWTHELGAHMHMSPTSPLLRCGLSYFLAGLCVGLFPPLEKPTFFS